MPATTIAATIRIPTNVPKNLWSQGTADSFSKPHVLCMCNPPNQIFLKQSISAFSSLVKTRSERQKVRYTIPMTDTQWDNLLDNIEKRFGAIEVVTEDILNDRDGQEAIVGVKEIVEIE